MSKRKKVEEPVQRRRKKEKKETRIKQEKNFDKHVDRDPCGVVRSALENFPR